MEILKVWRYQASSFLMNFGFDYLEYPVWVAGWRRNGWWCKCWWQAGCDGGWWRWWWERWSSAWWKACAWGSSWGFNLMAVEVAPLGESWLMIEEIDIRCPPKESSCRGRRAGIVVPSEVVVGGGGAIPVPATAVVPARFWWGYSAFNILLSVGSQVVVWGSPVELRFRFPLGTCGFESTGRMFKLAVWGDEFTL